MESAATDIVDHGMGLRRAYAVRDSPQGPQKRHAMNDRSNELDKTGNGATGGACYARAQLDLGRRNLARAELRRAHDAWRCAAAAFRASESPEEEVEALALCARAAALLGLDVEALEAAQLACRIADDLAIGCHTSKAYGALAVVQGWSRQFTQAWQAFTTAEQILARIDEPDAAQGLSRDRAWITAYRWACEDGNGAAPFDVRTQAPPDLGTEAWSPILEAWVMSEEARQAGRLDVAVLHSRRLAVLAREREIAPLACLALQSSSQLHLRQGEAEQAASQLTELLAYRHSLRAETLRSRAALVDSHFATARSQSQRMAAMAAESRQFERWAFEDALTGLANLRRFDSSLTAWTAAAADAGRPLSVALIDVDRFKQINDRFSHATGDAVLKGIASVMKEQVRGQDLPARWGGDEFAILFRDATETTALEVAHRIERAVQDRDWSSVAPGLRASVSVGVVQARAGDSKQDLINRSDAAMYANKRARDRREIERVVPPAVIETVAGWLRTSQHVVVFVGDRARVPVSGASASLETWSEQERGAFGHVDAWLKDPVGCAGYWQEWRRRRGEGRSATDTHHQLRLLARRLPSTTFVTERIDGLLGLAGIEDVIELYGNAFRDRCAACGTVRPNRANGRCLACGRRDVTIRPDIVLLGEMPDAKLLAGAEFSAKRAQLVLVVDSDARVFPGAGMLEKARARSARVVMLGCGEASRRDLADVSIDADPAQALRVLTEAMSMTPTPQSTPASLSPSGFSTLCFLTGQGTDDRGRTLDAILGWTDLEIERNLDVVPWMFPIPTPSRMNPQSPVPTVADFRRLASDELLRQGARRAMARLLRFYGFTLTDDGVGRTQHWEQSFALWAPGPTHHDLFISRILRGASLMGLRSEAGRWFESLEPEVRRFRGRAADVPLMHWRTARTVGA